MCIKSLGLGRGSTMDIVTRQRRRAFRNAFGSSKFGYSRRQRVEESVDERGG